MFSQFPTIIGNPFRCLLQFQILEIQFRAPEHGEIKRYRRFAGWDYAKGTSLFITGGTGFFGKSMLDYRLRHPEWEWAKTEWVILSRSPEKFAAEYPRLANQPGISFVAGDVRDFAFPAGHFDAVIHAATSAVTTLSDGEMTSVILDGARHVAGFAKTTGCDKILFTSSGAVYGPRITPAGEGNACEPTTAYGKGKLAAERMLVETGLDVKIARCFAFVGPCLNRNIHFAARHGLRAVSSVKTSLKMLVEKELVYPALDGYVVYDRLFAEYLRTH